MSSDHRKTRRDYAIICRGSKFRVGWMKGWIQKAWLRARGGAWGAVLVYVISSQTGLICPGEQKTQPLSLSSSIPHIKEMPNVVKISAKINTMQNINISLLFIRCP